MQRDESFGRYWSVEECRWVPCPVVLPELPPLPQQVVVADEDLAATK